MMNFDNFNTLDFDNLVEDFTSGDISEVSSVSDQCNGNGTLEENETSTSSGYSSSEDSSSSSSGSMFSKQFQLTSRKCQKKSRNRKIKQDYDLEFDDLCKRIVFATKPKIMKSDIRRSYANMFVNIVNSMDFPVLFGFLDTYFAPNASQKISKFKPVTHEPYNIDVEGVAKIAKYWYTAINMAPDCAVSVRDTKVHLTSATTRSKIVARFGLSGTMIYDTHPQHLVDEMKVEVVGAKRRDDMSEKLELISRIRANVDEYICNLPLRSEPVAVEVGAVLTMHTDERMFISKIELAFEKHGKPLTKDTCGALWVRV